MPTLAMSTKEQIVRVAERLFAERGIEAVSLREIGIAAGTANKSAVQYHFGSKDQLIDAIFTYRLPTLHGRRDLLIAEHQPKDLRGWLDCQVRAVLEQGELDGSYYMSFIAMLQERARRDVFDRVPTEFRQATDAVSARIAGFLTRVPEPLRTRRVATAMALMIHVAAGREHARADGRAVLPFVVELSDLVDCMVGFLEAPVSAATRRAVADVDLAAEVWPVLL